MAAKNKTKTRAKVKPTKTRPTKSRREKQPNLWQDDLGIGYATYDHEEDYVSPASTLDENQITSFQDFRDRLAKSPIFVASEVEPWRFSLAAYNPTKTNT